MKGAAVQGGATLLGHTLMNEMKETTGRERPDNSDDLSFPSTMSFGSAVFAGFASKNIHAMNVPSPAKTGMNVVVHTLPYAVAWERVEAKEHYPSDVLAGIAFGYFTSFFFNDLFMGIDEKMNGKPEVSYNGKELFIGYCLRF